jgi:hypothetical protein
MCCAFDRQFKRVRISLRRREQSRNKHPLCAAWLELRHINIDLGGPQGCVPLELLMSMERH